MSDWLDLSEHKLAVFGENVPQTERKFVLKVLQFAIGVDIIFIGFGRFARVQFDELIGDVRDGNFLTLLVTPAPQGLQGCAVSCAFGDFQSDDFTIENVGHDLTPNFGFSAATGSADLGWFDAEFGKP